MRAAEAVGLDPPDRSCVYHVALLRFLSCTSDASEIAALAGGDDVASNAAMAPVLLLTGSDSVPAVVEATRRAAAAIPDATIEVLDGHAHFAHRTDPHLVARIVRDLVAGY